MKGIQKETSRRPKNRKQYLYVRSLGPGCSGTCLTATQGGEFLSRKIPGAALWTSSARTAWRRRPRWIVCNSEPFLGDQKWRNPGREVWTVSRVTSHLKFCKSASCKSRDLYPWPSSGGQWPSALLWELLFVTHATILSPVCTFLTPARFFLNASGSFLFKCHL